MNNVGREAPALTCPCVPEDMCFFDRYRVIGMIGMEMPRFSAKPRMECKWRARAFADQSQIPSAKERKQPSKQEWNTPWRA